MNKRELRKEIFLKKGRLRKEILSRLSKPKTATELAKETGRHRSSVSRVLLDLKKKGFVKCVNPEDDRFRHYAKKSF